MGKSGGFLDFDRKDPGYRPKNKRVKDFEPVELRLEDAEVRAQAARCMDCGTPFCHGCGCPLTNLIPEFNDLIYRNRWKEALDILLQTGNFPEFTARVCPALCEASCVLGINDAPVTIRQIELAIIEKGFEKGYMAPKPPAKRINKRIAVVGSGPAGLAAADSLNRAGYYVTVYDRAQHAGGILRYGIPNFKLDKAIVDRRINLMKAEGVEFELGVTVGEDVSYKYLDNRFDAVCMSGGAREPRDLKVPGRELGGIYFAMQYLTQQNMLLMGEEIEPGTEISAKDRSVMIIGGGDTGSDCLGTAIRQGARKVTQVEIMPKPPVERPDSTPWPEWPNVYRESSSHKEGGDRFWCVNTRSFTGEDGRVKEAQCFEIEWVEGEGGRMMPKEKAGSDFTVDAELVLLSMGFVGPGRNKIVEDLKIELDNRGNIKADEAHMTSVDGVFVSGDMTRGQSLVVRAIADGRDTAAGIIEYLSNT